MRRRESKFGKDKRERKRKTSRVNGKNQALMRWKEEKAPLVLQKKIKAQPIREVEKIEKVGSNLWKRDKPSWFLR